MYYIVRSDYGIPGTDHRLTDTLEIWGLDTPTSLCKIMGESKNRSRIYDGPGWKIIRNLCEFGIPIMIPGTKLVF